MMAFSPEADDRALQGDHDFRVSMDHHSDSMSYLSLVTGETALSEPLAAQVHALLSIAAAVRALRETVDDLRRMQP